MGGRQSPVEKLVSRQATPDSSFWHDKRVLLTGHTGFKGAWTALWLARLGAEVHGFALPPATTPALWDELGAELASETLADLADRDAVRDAVARARPEIVLHMAAEALVRPSFADPVRTIATNAMGTVHLLEALRDAPSLAAALIVTTDKVYANLEAGRDFVESDPLGGHDPYSASKAAAEVLTRSYAASFFDPAGVKVATARAGNVIGGGDWSADRLVPDVWRAARSGKPLRLRAPDSTRPWQHVLEPVGGYLLYIEALLGERQVPRALNFGPPPGQSMTVGEVAAAVGAALGIDRPWERDHGPHPPEMKVLSIDPALARTTIGWEARLDFPATIEWTANWYARHLRGEPAPALCAEQIARYEALI